MGRHLFLEKLSCNILLCLLAVTMPWSSYAHPNSWQHIMEMYSVLPFATDHDGNVVEENFPIRRWLDTITRELIDDYNRVEIKEYGGLTFYQYLQNEFDFKLSFGNHRVLFHWGYNARPWNKELDNYVIDNEWSVEKIERFQAALISEQQRRNRIANNQAEKVFGFASSGKEAGWANGLLSIVYDTHLLGDYTLTDNKNFKGVTQPSVIAGDIINSIRRIDNSRTSEKLIDSIRKVTSEYSDQHLLAAELIKLLQRDLPKFLLSANEGSLKRRFEDCGFKIR